MLIIALSSWNCEGYIFQESLLIAPNDAYVITAVIHDGNIQFQAQPLPTKLNNFKSLIVDQVNKAVIISEGNKIIQLSAITGNINVLVAGIGSVTTMDFGN